MPGRLPPRLIGACLALLLPLQSHPQAVLLADGISVLLIEHHMDTIAALCDPVIVMAEGRHLRQGSFAELASDPVVQEAYMGRRR